MAGLCFRGPIQTRRIVTLTRANGGRPIYHSLRQGKRAHARHFQAWGKDVGRAGGIKITGTLHRMQYLGQLGRERCHALPSFLVSECPLRRFGKDERETSTALPVIMAMRSRQHGKGVV
jgi:hypothetical protein